MDIESAVSRMLTKEPKRQDRETEWVWKSPTQDVEKLDHTGEAVGVQIELELRHDAKRKQFIAIMRKVHYKDASTTGFSVTFFSPFDSVNYPSIVIARHPVARYSKTQAHFFETIVLEELANYCEQSEEVAKLVQLAASYA